MQNENTELLEYTDDKSAGIIDAEVGEMVLRIVDFCSLLEIEY